MVAQAAQQAPEESGADLPTLREISRRVLWLSAAIVDVANSRPGATSMKVGGHQASSASVVDVMVALWFHELTRLDRISVKPHASPVLHAINYLLGDLDEHYLPTLRAKGGLQSYPSRLKDPDTVDFSTGSVGIGATATVWAAMAHRYVQAHFPSAPPAGRFISILGDAELDEGAIWEAVGDAAVAQLGELLWIVDLNRQSLDRVIPDIQIERLQHMFSAAGWQVLTVKWGREIEKVFKRPGGEQLKRRLEAMSNEEYQRMLRVEAPEIADRVLHGTSSDLLHALVSSLSPAELQTAVRDLGGHDLGLLIDTFGEIDGSRPTVVFAYTIKGKDLPTQGHPNNHSALLSDAQMTSLAGFCAVDRTSPWRAFEHGTKADGLCQQRSAELLREPVRPAAPIAIPTSLGHPHRKMTSTQSAFGRLLADLKLDAPDVAARVVTCSPDVASSTNLGGWINKTGVWSVHDRQDWFQDDAERVLRWSEVSKGQHIELGIAEVNLVGLLGELGATWSRWGERLIPIATIYDPFVARALEPWSYGIYSGGQSILIGTPSGVTLASEGGAHQSISTPSIGVEQPGCVAWEPAFAQDLEWCLLHAMAQVGLESGTSAYFRLSTRIIDPSVAAIPTDPETLDRRRRLVVAGGYRLSQHGAEADDVLLVGVGAVMPEIVEAADRLESQGVVAGIVCLTSPDLVFRAFQAQAQLDESRRSGIIDVLFPAGASAPIVTAQDGHPHTLAFLGAIRGVRVRSLGVSEFGQSSSLEDAYRLHGLDAASVVDAALGLLGR